MKYDLVIKDGTIVTSKETIKADIGVANGRISFIGKINEHGSTEIFNAEGLFVLPGIIDSHVHFREPGLTEKEDFETGSRAAALSGITCVADMPNVIPPTSNVKLFNEKVAIVREKSYIDFGLFALLNNHNADEIEGLVKAGALGFKVFLGTSTGEIAAPSQAVLLEQLKKCYALGIRTGFHAETNEINEFYTEKYKNEKTDIPQGVLFCESRPIKSETKAIERALGLSKKTNAKIHIHHVTSKQGIELIAKAKQDGINVTAETCPHYLFMNAENHFHKVYPPIRYEEDRLALWDAVKSGVIDMIATDHAPHTAKEKSLPLWEAPAGLAGIETFVNLFLNEVNKGTITLNDFVRLAGEKPAKIWGIKQKGEISVNKDADFTIVDMNKKIKIDADKLFSKSKTTPFNGLELQGIPAATIVRGKIIMEYGSLKNNSKGCGKLIRVCL